MNTTTITGAAVAATFDHRPVQRTARANPAALPNATPWPWPLPNDSVLAALADRTALPDLLGTLRAAGVGFGDVWTASGPAGARRLREASARRGLLGRLSALINEEGELLDRIEAWCAAGAELVLVRARRGRMSDVTDALARHGGAVVRRGGRWTFSGGAAPTATTAASGPALPRQAA
jgi:hypothetical protein